MFTLAGLLLALATISPSGDAGEAILPNISALLPGDHLGGNFPNSLVLLGTVYATRKMYFVETAQNLTWLDAVNHCESFSMKLATIDTGEEVDFLRDAYEPSHFNGYFWTSGRDSHELRQFSWDATGQNAASTPGLNMSRYMMAAMTCLNYVSNRDGSHLVGDRCTRQAGAICQTR